MQVYVRLGIAALRTSRAWLYKRGVRIAVRGAGELAGTVRNQMCGSGQKQNGVNTSLGLYASGVNVENLKRTVRPNRKRLKRSKHAEITSAKHNKAVYGTALVRTGVGTKSFDL